MPVSSKRFSNLCLCTLLSIFFYGFCFESSAQILLFLHPDSRTNLRLFLIKYLSSLENKALITILVWICVLINRSISNSRSILAIPQLIIFESFLFLKQVQKTLGNVKLLRLRKYSNFCFAELSLSVLRLLSSFGFRKNSAVRRYD